WDRHLRSFAELPERSIVYHVDQGDIFKVHEVLGGRFCFSGGVPNTLLSIRPADEVRRCCKRIIEGVAAEGGYIMDAAAIIQNDAKVENVRAMTDATREYGVYSRGHATPAGAPKPAAEDARPGAFVTTTASKRPPGTCLPWPDVRPTLPEIRGDEALCERIWQSVDALGAMFVWWIALAF
ncbi:MAG: hypothetical protein HUU20_27535, partial [Pirellulales bacterium]|nr:hypothetical protein [Pirellulales bacterium]